MKRFFMLLAYCTMNVFLLSLIGSSIVTYRFYLAGGDVVAGFLISFFVLFVAHGFLLGNLDLALTLGKSYIGIFHLRYDDSLLETKYSVGSIYETHSILTNNRRSVLRSIAMGGNILDIKAKIIRRVLWMNATHRRG